MKNYAIIWFLIVSFLVSGCTDVIEIEVPQEPPRLVIEASIDWKKGTSGRFQTVNLSLSTPYFDNLTTTPVEGAMVKVIMDDEPLEFVFQDESNGTYSTDQFVPFMRGSYTLVVEYDGETYMANEVLTPVTDIKAVFQSRESGFDKNALEVNIEFLDPVDEKNFYLTKFQRRGDLFPTLFDVKDEFTNGNIMNFFYEKRNDEDTGEKEFEPGDIVDISLYGISEEYYNYIKLLINQSGNDGGPFTSVPAEVKGNCYNITNPDHYPFGYFRLTEVDERVYQFKQD